MTITGAGTARADDSSPFAAAAAWGGSDAFMLTLAGAFVELERPYWKFTRVTDPLDPEQELWSHEMEQGRDEAAFLDADVRDTFAGLDAFLLVSPTPGLPAPLLELETGGNGFEVTAADSRTLGPRITSPDVTVGEGEEGRYYYTREITEPHFAAGTAEGVLRVRGNFTLHAWDLDLLAHAAGESPKEYRTGERSSDQSGPAGESEVAYARLVVTDGVLEVRGADASELLVRTMGVTLAPGATATLPHAVGGYRAGDTKYEATGEDVTLAGTIRVTLSLLDGDLSRALVDVAGVLTDISLAPAPASTDAPFLQTPAGRAAAAGGGVLVLLAGAAVLVGRDRPLAAFGRVARSNPFRHPVPRSRESRVEEAVAALADGDDRRAVKLLGVLLAERPDDVVLLVDHGCALERLSRTRDARDAFERAVTVEPGNAEAHYYYARVLARLGVTASALPHLQRAMALDPRLREMARADQGFRALADHPSFLALVT